MAWYEVKGLPGQPAAAVGEKQHTAVAVAVAVVAAAMPFWKRQADRRRSASQQDTCASAPVETRQVGEQACGVPRVSVVGRAWPACW